METKYGNFRLRQENIDRLKDMRLAFESCYAHRMTNDEFIDKLIASVEGSEPAVWDKYCSIVDNGNIDGIPSVQDALKDYRKVIETEIDGVVVRVWKPVSMERLPAHCLKICLESKVLSVKVQHRYNPAVLWSGANPDYGCWDARLAVRLDSVNNCVDVYFCSLLCRPFSKQAYIRYGKLASDSLVGRLAVQWDSRVFDRENGYTQDYGTIGPGSDSFIYSVNTDSDLAENC